MPRPDDATGQNYSFVSKFLHWGSAVVMTSLFALGVYMIDLGYYDENYTASYSIHKGVGMIAILIASTQILWAVSNKSPMLVATLKPWERISAKLMHWILFALILIVPLSGYGIAVAAGQGVDIFGFFSVPAILPGVLMEMENLESLMSNAHFYLAYGSASLVLFHVVAALKHHFIDRDRTLRRMLWG